MTMLTEKAIAKMADEIKGKDELIPFEEYLTSICTTDAVAEKILTEEKSLQGAFDAMYKVAKGRKKGNFAYISPEEGFAIIREYYGIVEEKPEPEEFGQLLDITDLL